MCVCFFGGGGGVGEMVTVCDQSRSIFVHTNQHSKVTVDEQSNLFCQEQRLILGILFDLQFSFQY